MFSALVLEDSHGRTLANILTDGLSEGAVGRRDREGVLELKLIKTDPECKVYLMGVIKGPREWRRLTSMAWESVVVEPASDAGPRGPVEHGDTASSILDR